MSHLGIVKMKSTARSYFWWPHIDNDIEKIAKSCKECIQERDNPPAATLHPWNWPNAPWHRISQIYSQ